MKYTDIKIKRYGRTVLICIDRPSSLNAFTPSTVEELNEAIDEFENDNELWTAVLTGSGEKAFCVGADLKWMASNLDAKREDWKTHDGIWKKKQAHEIGNLVIKSILNILVILVESKKQRLKSFLKKNPLKV